MGMLKLQESLKLDGDLDLNGKVLIDGSELLVQSTSKDLPHSLNGAPPLPNDSSSTQIWMTGSANKGVRAGGKPAITTDGLQYKRGAQEAIPGKVQFSMHKIKIGKGNALAVKDTVTIGPVTMTLTNSGQKET